MDNKEELIQSLLVLPFRLPRSRWPPPSPAAASTFSLPRRLFPPYGAHLLLHYIKFSPAISGGLAAAVWPAAAPASVLGAGSCRSTHGLPLSTPRASPPSSSPYPSSPIWASSITSPNPTPRPNSLFSASISCSLSLEPLVRNLFYCAVPYCFTS